jgi:serine phosphatase RsbU (regulator of sigma subunit)
MVSPSLARPRPTPLRSLLTLLWRQSLLALPFTAFFGLLFGGGPASFALAFRISLVFAYVIGLHLWAAEHLVAPRLRIAGDPLKPGGFARHAALHLGASVAGSYVAALIVHLFVSPGFLGSARSVLVVTMFALLFTALIGGLIYGWHFYRSALARARAEEEMALARRIQRGFLLTAFPRRPRLEVHAVNLSSREVSGDFYDVVPAGDDAFLVAVADVSGKGVPAALLSSMLQASLRTQAGRESSTAAILRDVNALVCGSTSRQQFATFFVARVDERALTLTYTNAGHNPPVLVRDGAPPCRLTAGGTIVGMIDDIGFEEETVGLRPGDRVFIYTDGLSEAEAPDGAMFGDDRVAHMVSALPADLGAEAVCGEALARLRDWLGGREPGDDVTVLALRVRPDDAPPARG